MWWRKDVERGRLVEEARAGNGGRKRTKRIEKRGCARGLRYNKKAQQKLVERRKVCLRG
jgi:hypothetical protein